MQFEAFALPSFQISLIAHENLGDRQESLSVEWQCGSVVNMGVITTKDPENRPDLERVDYSTFIKSGTPQFSGVQSRNNLIVGGHRKSPFSFEYVIYFHCRFVFPGRFIRTQFQELVEGQNLQEAPYSCG